MNKFEFARRYGVVYVVVASIVICIASVFYSAIEPMENWGFLIYPVGYFAFIYDVGYNGIYKAGRNKFLFIVFFLAPWLVSAGFAVYRTIIKFGLAYV